jgi:acetylornithine deacetylase/succinyl-diaminopimelate desuccinylase-like protein
MSISRPFQYASAHRPRFVKELGEFVRLPSISSQPKGAEGIERCAQWVARHLRKIGLERSTIIRTARHPAVFASWEHAPGRPTVLVYGHYDVLPPDPVAEWRTPPFEPTVRGNNMYGRGACDDKGQVFAHFKAMESWLKTARALPVNVKCLIEGEEEIDSPNLPALVRKYRRALAADVAVVSDSPMLAPDRPVISYGQRGSLRLELELRGAAQDLHSGNFGGAVHNPLQAVAEILCSLHDRGGRVAIPGFYDRVRHAGPAERNKLRQAAPSDTQILREAGAARGWGDAEYTLYERTALRPALTFNGIAGGYQGPGVKAVIPSRARAKLSFRLVPDQDPAEIDALFRRYIERIAPPTVHAEVRTVSSARPALLDPDHPGMRAAVFAYRKGFGASPVFLRTGGSLPVVSIFQETLGIPTVQMGFALPDDRMHAPNEKFYLPNLYRGISASTWFLAAAGKALRESHDGLPQTAMERRAVAYGD